MTDLGTHYLTADRDWWKRRAVEAEAVARYALWMHPLRQETAQQFADRLRQHVEACHPNVITRSEHQRVEVLPLAEDCGCDPEGVGYDDDHCESDQGGEYLCARRHLGFICDTCVNEDDGGPKWKPDRYEWPCPAIAALTAAGGGS